MGVNTQKYIRKPLYVEAVRVTPQNFDELVAWCQGEVETKTTAQRKNKKYIKVRVHHPKNPRQTQAFVGDWILYTDRGYKVYTNDAFRAAFDEVEEEREATAEEIREKLPHAEDRRPTTPPQDDRKTHEPPLPEPPVVEPGADLGTTPQGEQIEVVAATPQAIADTVNEQSVDKDFPEGRIEEKSDEFTVREAHRTVPVKLDEEDADRKIEQTAKPEPVETPSKGIVPVKPEMLEDVPAAGTPIVPPEVAPQPEPISEQAPQNAAAGKYVLSEEEQAELGPEGVRELIASGEAVLAQDLAESA